VKPEELLRRLGRMEKDGQVDAPTLDAAKLLEASELPELDPTLLAPLSPELEARIAANALREVKAARVLRPRWRLPVAVFAAAAAGIAGVVFFVAGGTGRGLPVYGLAIKGGEQRLRDIRQSATAAPIELREGSLLTLELIPETPVHEPVEVATFVLRDGELLDWSTHIETSNEGSARIEAELRGGLVERSGALELILVIAPAGELPRREALQRDDRATIFRVPAVVRPR
jgi:hypothetical protein